LDVDVINHFETREKELVWICLGLNTSISRFLTGLFGPMWQTDVLSNCLRSALFTNSQKKKTGKCMPKGQNQSDIVGSVSV